MNTQPLILVAEDEDLMRAIISRLLEESGYRVAAVASAEEMLEAFTAPPSSRDKSPVPAA